MHTHHKMRNELTKKRRHREMHEEEAQLPTATTAPTSDSMEVEDLRIPDELIRDEEDREHLLEMTELERELELDARAETLRRETERQDLIGAEQPQEKSSSATSEELTDIDEEKMVEHHQQTEIPSGVHRSASEEAESVSERVTEDSDSDVKEVVENEAEYSDYVLAQIFRGDLERWLNEPHFDESVPGCFVRFHGEEAAKLDRNRCEYLMVEVVKCQINEEIAPYPFGVGNKSTKMQLLLKRGDHEFWSRLNVISNASFTIKEFEEWVQACKRHNRPLPSKMELEDRKEQIDQARKFVFTHDEVKKILEEKRKQGSLKISNVMQRAHLIRLRDFYRDQEDNDKVEEYETQIKELEAKAEAIRKSRSTGIIDKQSTAREKQLKAESHEALIERRRPRVIEKFEKKLQKLPPERHSMALLKFYGPSHPLCLNIQESDVKKPCLKRSPSPEFEPPLPSGILHKPDLERDFNNRSFYDCMHVHGEEMDADKAKRLLNSFLSKNDTKMDDKRFGRYVLEGWKTVFDQWNGEIESKIESGEINVIQYPK